MVRRKEVSVPICSHFWVPQEPPAPCLQPCSCHWGQVQEWQVISLFGVGLVDFCNYPLLHLLMGYLICLVENLSCQEFQICYKLYTGHFDEDALAETFSLGIKIPWARTELVSLAVKRGCQFVLEMEYGKEQYFSMPFYIAESLGLLFGSHILHLRGKVRETLMLSRILRCNVKMYFKSKVNSKNEHLILWKSLENLSLWAEFPRKNFFLNNVFGTQLSLEDCARLQSTFPIY